MATICKQTTLALQLQTVVVCRSILATLRTSTGTTDLTIVSIYWPHRIRSSSLPEDARLYNRNEDDISVGSLAGGAELEMQMKVAVSDFARSSWPTWTRELDEER